MWGCVLVCLGGWVGVCVHVCLISLCVLVCVIVCALQVCVCFYRGVCSCVSHYVDVYGCVDVCKRACRSVCVCV